MENAARADGILQGALFWLFQSYSDGQNTTNGGRNVMGPSQCFDGLCGCTLAEQTKEHHTSDSNYAVPGVPDRVDYGIIPLDTTWCGCDRRSTHDVLSVKKTAGRAPGLLTFQDVITAHSLRHWCCCQCQECAAQFLHTCAQPAMQGSDQRHWQPPGTTAATQGDVSKSPHPELAPLLTVLLTGALPVTVEMTLWEPCPVVCLRVVACCRG